MSFIGKAVKKVFNFGKKIVKKVGRAFQNKWFRTAFLAAAAVFAVGVGSSGYEGFGNLMANSGAESTVGAFFSAVGSTLAQGFGTITSSIGGMFGAGQESASHPFYPSGLALPVGNVLEPGLGQETISEVVKVAAPAATKEVVGEVIKEKAEDTLISRFMGSVFSPSTTGTFMRSAIIGGISYWGKQQQWKAEQKRADQATVWGGPAFGGSKEVPEGFIRKPIVGGGDPNASTAKQLIGETVKQQDEQAAARYTPQIANRQHSKTLQAPLLGGATNLQELEGVAPLLNNPRGVV